MKKIFIVLACGCLLLSCTGGDGIRMGRKAAMETLRAAEADEREYGFLPDADEGHMEAAAAYFEARGPLAERVSAWEYLGLVQEQESASHRAVISYGKALDAARKAGDDAAQGRIGRRLAHVYNVSREYVPAARELYSAWLAYRRAAEKAEKSEKTEKAAEKAGPAAAETLAGQGTTTGESALRHEERATLLEYGQAWYSLDNLEQAEKVYKAALSEAHAAGDTLVEVGVLRSYAALALQKDPPEPAAAVEMLSRVADDLHYPLQSSDQGVLAASYSLLGKPEEARDRLRRAFAQAETREELGQARFRAYQTASHEGRSADALKALEKVVEYGNDADLSAMRAAVSLAREDYLDAQNALATERLRSSRWGSAALILLLIAVASTALWYLRARREEIRRLRSETEETIGIAEELRARLAESSRVLKGAVAGKNEILERLCEQYYIYGESDKLPSRLLKEARSAIEGLRDDPKTLEGFERMVNAAHDGAVDKLRTQLPRCKEEDVRLFILAASGLSRTAMATILEKEKGVVNNRLWRLKGRLADSDAPDKALLLECLEG